MTRGFPPLNFLFKMTKPKTESKGSSIFFIKNYLILIIGLVVLVCISIGVAFAFSAQYLESAQKWFLIIALTFFAFFSVGIATWLILRHSRKLIVSEKDSELEWNVASPDKQKRSLNTEVREIAKLMEIPVEQMSDLRSAYIVAEDLALRKIQEEANMPIMRHVNIGNTVFDGVYLKDDLVTCVDVTFLVTPDVSQEKIDFVLRKISSAKTTFDNIRKGSKIRLLLVLVTQLDEEAEAKLRSKLINKFSSTPVDVDIKLFDFHTLQKIYAED